MENFGLYTRKVVECCEQSSMDHPSRSLEDSSDECSVVCEGLMKEISEGNNINN